MILLINVMSYLAALAIQTDSPIQGKVILLRECARLKGCEYYACSPFIFARYRRFFN